MKNAIADAYSAHPYPNYLHEFAHPGRVLAIAALYGAPLKTLNSLRILELGCNRGTTLNWIARQIPHASCRGIDIDAMAIAEAQKVAPDNASFSRNDLTTLTLGDAKFDYILAHGMFSGLTDPARDSLLSIAGKHLAPGGVLMLSWNALPGSLYRSAIRELMLLESGAGRPFTKALNRLQTGLVDFQKLPHHKLLSTEVSRLSKADENYLAHDDAGVEMEPFYLLQIASWAAQHGLSYLTDCSFGLDWLAFAPRAAREALDGLTRLDALQYLDFLNNPPFRRSLFVRVDDQSLQRSEPDPAVLPNLKVLSNFDIKGKGSKALLELRDRDGKVKLPSSQTGRALIKAIEKSGICTAGELLTSMEYQVNKINSKAVLEAAAHELIHLSL